MAQSKIDCYEKLVCVWMLQEHVKKNSARNLVTMLHDYVAVSHDHVVMSHGRVAMSH